VLVFSNRDETHSYNSVKVKLIFQAFKPLYSLNYVQVLQMRSTIYNLFLQLKQDYQSRYMNSVKTDTKWNDCDTVSTLRIVDQ